MAFITVVDERGAAALEEAKLRAFVGDWAIDKSHVSNGSRAADALVLLAHGLTQCSSAATKFDASRCPQNDGVSKFTVRYLPQSVADFPVGTDPLIPAAVVSVYKSFGVCPGKSFSAESGSRTYKNGLEDAGVAPLLVIGVVLGVGAVAAAAWHWADAWSSTKSLEIERRENTQRLLNTQTQLVEFLEQHNRKESASGSTQPLSDAEKAVLSALVSSNDANISKAAAELKVNPNQSTSWPLLLPLFLAVGSGILIAGGNKS